MLRGRYRTPQIMSAVQPGTNRSEEIRTALEQVAQYGVPGDPAAARVLDVGSDGYLRYFQEEVLEDLLAKGGATCRFIEGAYGSGKTHLLQLLRELALSRGMAVAWTDLSQALSLEDWRLITLHVLQKVEARIDGETVRTLPRILEAWGPTGRANLDALKQASLAHPGFQTAMFRVAEGTRLSPPALDLVHRYLLGEKVGAGQLRKLGVTGIKNPLSSRNAEQVLSTALDGLTHLGLPGTMLLFDENEQTLAVERNTVSRKIQIGANLMRRLIDGCANGTLTGTVAVFAVIPGFLERCARAYPALGQRLQVIRREDPPPAWRWPVLPIHAITTVERPEEFLTAAIGKMEQLVLECGGEVNGLQAAMRSAGTQVLERQAGDGYRRELMKLLAVLAMNQMEP